MKKILFAICFLFLAATQANAFTVRQAVILNTDINTAEQLLIDTVNLYKTKFTLIEANKEKHLYTVRYDIGLNVAKPTSNINIQINPDEERSNYGTLSDYGGFSCTFKSLNSDTLVTCRKISMTFDYIYNHYEKYFRELRLNGYQYVSYKKYLKLKNNL